MHSFAIVSLVCALVFLGPTAGQTTWTATMQSSASVTTSPSNVFTQTCVNGGTDCATWDNQGGLIEMDGSASVTDWTAINFLTYDLRLDNFEPFDDELADWNPPIYRFSDMKSEMTFDGLMVTVTGEYFTDTSSSIMDCDLMQLDYNGNVMKDPINDVNLPEPLSLMEFNQTQYLGTSDPYWGIPDTTTPGNFANTPWGLTTRFAASDPDDVQRLDVYQIAAEFTFTAFLSGVEVMPNIVNAVSGVQVNMSIAGPAPGTPTGFQCYFEDFDGNSFQSTVDGFDYEQGAFICGPADLSSFQDGCVRMGITDLSDNLFIGSALIGSHDCSRFNNCNGNGVCSTDPNMACGMTYNLGAVCQCNTGFRGLDCSIPGEDISDHKWHSDSHDLLLERSAAAVASNGNEVHIYGGYNSAGTPTALHKILYLDTWSVMDVDTFGVIPALGGASGAFADGSFYVFFGEDNFNNVFSDLFYYDPDNYGWIWPYAYPAPPSRKFAASTVLSDRYIVTWGGVDPLDGTVFQDTWVYDVVDEEWHQVALNNATIVAAHSAQMWSAPGDKLVIYGGSTNADDQTWPTEQVIIVEAANIISGAYKNDGNLTSVVLQADVGLAGAALLWVDGAEATLQGGFSSGTYTMVDTILTIYVTDLEVFMIEDGGSSRSDATWDAVSYSAAFSPTPGVAWIYGGGADADGTTKGKNQLAGFGVYTCDTNEDPFYSVTPCFPCATGSSPVLQGAEIVCQTCEFNERTLNRGGACESCPVGEEPVWNTGNTQVLGCNICNPGYYNDDPTGTTACTLCAEGTWNAAYQAEECQACPDNSETPTTGASSEEECECSYGFYTTTDANDCQACPNGAICEGGLSIPEPQAGFWADPEEPYSVFSCPSASACPGGTNGECETGFGGRLCGSCESGFYALQTECVECPDSPGLKVAFLGAGFVLAMGALVKITQFGINCAVFSVVLAYVQTTAILVNFDVRWPTGMRWIFGAFDTLNFSIDMTSPECMGEFGYAEKLKGSLAIPVIAVFAFLILFVVSYLRNKSKAKKQVAPSGEPELDKNGKPKKPDPLAHLPVWKRTAIPLVNVFTMFLGFIYVMLASKAFDLYRCTAQPNGDITFDKNTEWRCYESEEWLTLQPLALFAIFAYALGIPIGLGLMLRWSRKNMQAAVYAASFSKVTERYEDEWYWWEPIVMLRKLAFVVIPIFGGSSTLFQTVFGIMTFMISLLLQTYARPFDNIVHDILEGSLLGVDLTILFGGLLFFSEKIPPEVEPIVEWFLVGVVGVSAVVIGWFSFFDIFSQIKNLRAIKMMASGAGAVGGRAAGTAGAQGLAKVHSKRRLKAAEREKELEESRANEKAAVVAGAAGVAGITSALPSPRPVNFNVPADPRVALDNLWNYTDAQAQVTRPLTGPRQGAALNQAVPDQYGIAQQQAAMLGQFLAGMGPQEMARWASIQASFGVPVQPSQVMVQPQASPRVVPAGQPIQMQQQAPAQVQAQPPPQGDQPAPMYPPIN